MSPLLHVYLFHLHVFFSVMFFMGIGLIYGWIKTLPQRQRMQATFWIFGVGTLGAALTVPFCFLGMNILMG